MVLKRCGQSIQSLPDPLGFGWDSDDNNLIPLLTDELPAPIGLIELSMCGCKGLCDTNRCTCYKNNLVCTDMCKCSEDCMNDGNINNEENEENDVDELESDDEVLDE